MAIHFSKLKHHGFWLYIRSSHTSTLYYILSSELGSLIHMVIEQAKFIIHEDIFTVYMMPQEGVPTEGSSYGRECLFLFTSMRATFNFVRRPSQGLRLRSHFSRYVWRF
jgi:hypothetical protein